MALPELGVEEIKVKVDTGAHSSAIHAFDVEEFERDGEAWVRFDLHPFQRDSKTSVAAEARLVGRRWVKSSSGSSTLRPVIKTRIKLGKKVWRTEITLVRRDVMGFRMLLGRRSVRRRFLVDPGRSFLASKPATRRGKAAKKRSKKSTRKASPTARSTKKAPSKKAPGKKAPKKKTPAKKVSAKRRGAASPKKKTTRKAAGGAKAKKTTKKPRAGAPKRSRKRAGGRTKVAKKARKGSAGAAPAGGDGTGPAVAESAPASKRRGGAKAPGAAARPARRPKAKR